MFFSESLRWQRSIFNLDNLSKYFRYNHLIVLSIVVNLYYYNLPKAIYLVLFKINTSNL